MTLIRASQNNALANKNSLGMTIRRLRVEKGRQAKYVAYTAKLDPAIYCRIEHGKQEPSFNELKHIAEALDTNMAYVTSRWSRQLKDDGY